MKLLAGLTRRRHPRLSAERARWLRQLRRCQNGQHGEAVEATCRYFERRCSFCGQRLVAESGGWIPFGPNPALEMSVETYFSTEVVPGSPAPHEVVPDRAPRPEETS